MIYIQRTECPEKLKNSPVLGKKYNATPVVEALWEMQHHKCCYCEMSIPPKGHLKAVEHFEPKSIFKSKINDWVNLLLACAQCNGKKSNQFPILLTTKDSEPKILYINKATSGTTMVINPSVIDPEEYLTYCLDNSKDDYGVICSIDDNELGNITIRVIGLDDFYYTRECRDHLYTLEEAYLNLLRAKDQNNTDMLDISKDKFKLKMSNKHKLSALSRSFAKKKNLSRFNI